MAIRGQIDRLLKLRQQYAHPGALLFLPKGCRYEEAEAIPEDQPLNSEKAIKLLIEGIDENIARLEQEFAAL